MIRPISKCPNQKRLNNIFPKFYAQYSSGRWFFKILFIHKKTGYSVWHGTSKGVYIFSNLTLAFNKMSTWFNSDCIPSFEYDESLNKHNLYFDYERKN